MGCASTDATKLFSSKTKKPPSQEAITSNINDAYTELPFLDDFSPRFFNSMGKLEKDEYNRFLLKPGLYEHVGESFCIQPGTHGPSEGKGYLLASLKGPRADILKAITRRSVSRPDIPQREIQLLIWSIIVDTPLDEMPPPRARTAKELLQPEELAQLKKDVFQAFTEEAKKIAIKNAPAAVKDILRARAKLRDLLKKASSSYKEIEKVAVLAGAAPIESEIRHVPKGRWSYDPDGFYIRFLPERYKKTVTQVYVPEPVDIEFDGIGRITSIDDKRFNRIEIEYKNNEELLSRTDRLSVSAHQFKRIKYFYKLYVPEAVVTHVLEWRDVGWTFVGMPNSNVTPNLDELRFPEYGMRYNHASRNLDEIKALRKSLGIYSDVELDTLANLIHLNNALTQVFRTPPLQGRDNGSYNPTEMVMKAQQTVLCAHLGKCASVQTSETSTLYTSKQPSLAMMYLPLLEGTLPLPERTRYDASETIAMPANKHSQRLLQSPRENLSTPKQKKLTKEQCKEQISRLEDSIESGKKMKACYADAVQSAKTQGDLDKCTGGKQPPKASDISEEQISEIKSGKDMMFEVGDYDICTRKESGTDYCKTFASLPGYQKPACNTMTDATKAHEAKHAQDSLPNSYAFRIICNFIPRTDEDIQKIIKTKAELEPPAYDESLKALKKGLEDLKQGECKE